MEIKKLDRAAVCFAGIFLLWRALFVLTPVVIFYKSPCIGGEIIKALFYGGAVFFIVTDVLLKRKVLIGNNVFWLLALGVITVISEIAMYPYTNPFEFIKHGIKSTIQVFFMYTAGMRMSRRDQQRFLCCLHSLLSLVFVPVLGYMFYQFWSTQHYVVEGTNQGWFEGRLFGIMTSPFAGSITIAVLTFGSAYRLLRERGWPRVIYALELAIYILYLALADTRTVFVACAAGMGYLIFGSVCRERFAGMNLKRCVSKGILLFMVAAFGIFGLKWGIRSASFYAAWQGSEEETKFSEFAVEEDRPEQTFTSGRAYIWKSYLNIMTDKPSHLLLGMSVSGSSSYIRDKYPEEYIVDYFKDAYPEAYEQGEVYAAHNTYLTVLVYTGLGGLAALLIFLLKCAASIWRRTVGGKVTGFESLLCVIVLIVLTSGFFESDPFFNMTVTDCLFWMAAGMLINNSAKDDILPALKDRNGREELLRSADNDINSRIIENGKIYD